MNVFEDIGIWFHGYKPANLANDAAEDRNPISMIGWSVMFATLIAAINWGVAGWVYSTGQDSAIRYLAVAMSTLLGMALVLVFDRSFLYFVDTQQGGKLGKVLAYAAIRVALILMVGSLTSQAVMPLFLNSELSAHALKMAEDSDRTRASELSARYDVNGKAKVLTASQTEVNTLEKAMQSLPADIQDEFARVQSCWQGYQDRKQARMATGETVQEARVALSDLATTCSRIQKSARERRSAYLTSIRAQLSKARQAKQAHEASLIEANESIKSKVDKAAEIENIAFNPRSSTVLWSLISSDIGAMTKWALISLLLVVLELLPMLLKLQAGKSLVGRRIAFDRKLRMLMMEESVHRHEHDFSIASAVNMASMGAIDEALRSKSVHDEFVRAFASNMAAFAPVESVRAMMREMEARHVDVQDFIQRYPRYADVISEAWSNAMVQTTDILKRGIRVSGIASAQG